MADIKIKIPNDMEQDVFDAFWEAFPPADQTITHEDNCIDRIDRFVEDVYVAYMDKLALDTVKTDAAVDLEEEKEKNKDKSKEIITTK